MPREISETIYEQPPRLPDATPTLDVLSSAATRPTHQLSPNFLRTLVIIISTITFFFLLILFLIVMLLKSRRLRLLSSFEDKVSASSFVQSTSTAISNDFSNDIYQFKPRSISNMDYGGFIEQSFRAPEAALTGLVPQNNLSPRFYRHHQNFSQRRAPLYIQSPSLSDPHRSELSTTTQEPYVSQPRMTHLHNGDVIISA